MEPKAYFNDMFSNMFIFNSRDIISSDFYETEAWKGSCKVYSEGFWARKLQREQRIYLNMLSE
jgi:hypothetical protein